MKIDISKYKDVELKKYRFCLECGGKLILKKAYISGYDWHTGEPEIRLLWKCPNQKWWKVWEKTVFFQHSDHVTNEKGE